MTYLADRYGYVVAVRDGQSFEQADVELLEISRQSYSELAKRTKSSFVEQHLLKAIFETLMVRFGSVLLKE